MTTSHKLIKLITAVVLTCLVCLTFVPGVALAEERSDSPIIVLDAGAMEDNRITIVATLARNSGIMGMTLSLDYDDNALKLVRAVDGNALYNLDKMHSGTLSTKPYNVNYLWVNHENDYSKGTLLTFTFEVKDGAKNGSYIIQLAGQRNSVLYLDEDDQECYKNIVGDSVKVTVERNEVVEVQPHGKVDPIDPTPGDPNNSQDNVKKPDYLSIAIAVTIVVLGLLILTLVLVLTRGKDRKK